jgi:acylphosphatase
MTDQLDDKPARAHVYISGRVQGVGFRWNTLHMAQQLELTGWVRNLWDGRVEAVFEGPADKVQQAVAWCRHGQRPAQVDTIQVSQETPTGEYNYFRVAS